MGYFTFDLIWCYVHNETPLVKFHHWVTVTGLLYYSFKLRQQHTIIYSLGLTEFTNPFLQTRWYLKYHNLRDGWFFKIIETIFIISFFYIRLFVCTYYAYRAFTEDALNMTADDLSFITLGMIVGYCLSYQMISYIVYQLKKSKSSRIDKHE
jgi:hypothetical protein